MESMKFIKQDAQVPISFGTDFIQRLQKTFVYLVENKTQEDLDLFQKLLESGKPLDEEWMEATATVGQLLKEIETSANKLGLTYEKDLTTQQDS